MDLANNLAEWVSLLIIIATAIVSWFHRDNKVLLPIQLYIVVSLALNVLLKITDFLPKSDLKYFYLRPFINIYSIFEISIILYFIRSIISGRRFRTVLFLLYFIFLLAFVFICAKDSNGIFFHTPSLFGVENLLITIACFFYMYEIFKSDENLNFKSDSKFIVVSGMVFYFSISTPFFFGAYNIFRIGLFNVFSLLNIFYYTLLFISFLKAYLCPFPAQKK